MDYSFIIIDSNATSCLQLQLMLKDYGDFSSYGTARDSQDGLNQIMKFLPDVVLVNLDGQPASYFLMMTELHRYLDEVPLFIAFSKSKEHAYDALKYGFFDYWLLPHDEMEIRKTIFKLRKLNPKTDIPVTLCLKSYRDYHYINTKDILYLKADNNATDFFMKDGSTISAFKTLKTFESQLPHNFIRIHQSYILNADYVSRINYGKATCTLKVDENRLPFSKTYLDRIDTLKQILSKNAVQAT
ncbi:LytTR family transcriptional regulator DNA-binding domain-containing protein [Allomuricauda sp. d1]|uniref:LytR/AlgR family response regulator transcription factor n=1 Tax=Allomuricauda sp. d1 TaxID=3136725 RepID=UPI0031DB2B85